MNKSKDTDKNKGACRYPIAINKTQERILFPWINGLRYLWNHYVALIRRARRMKIKMRLFYEETHKFNEEKQKYVHYNLNGTNKRLTKIRAKNERQRSIPNCAQQEMLRRLDSSYKKFLFNKIMSAQRQVKIAEAQTPKQKAKAFDYGFPKFKKKYQDIISIYFGFGRFSVIQDEDKWYLEASKIPGRIRILTNKDMPENIKNLSISYDPVKLMWFASFTYITQFVAKDYPVKDVVALDVGTRKSCTTSDEKYYYIDKETILKLEHKKERLERLLDKKDGGSKESKTFASKRYRKFAHKIRKIDREISNIRRNFQHQLSKELSDTYPIIGAENLSVSKMMASAKGTVDKPGKNVKQKSRLNRAIAREGWYQLRSMIEYKQKRNGGLLVLVDPAYSSQTCPLCGHISKFNRCGEEFKCVKCGKELDADYGASLEIKKRTIAAVPPQTLEQFGIKLK